MAEQENDPQVGNTTEEDDDDSAKEKETFQWNTPADEFAEDVASDVEEESEDEAIADANRDNSTGEIIELSHQSEIINGQIGLGEPEEKPKKAKPKHQFPCPKCNKIWNWPWELRRHLVMHFKEVSFILTQNLRLFICLSESNTTPFRVLLKERLTIKLEI